eukprot:TRINITY_DN7835_c0_g1_i1.p1 TRINITY_DN7835_c0_g1~~TRINITY_DN7835_c0_g1_i1.p1  ORF type:complete len:120 (+),score=8.18 TRINITY_DN7835_c0_g1_i1:96-455(+)
MALGTVSTRCSRLTGLKPILDEVGCHRDEVKVAAATLHARCAGLSQLIHDLIVHHDLVALHRGLPDQSAISTRFAFVANQRSLPPHSLQKEMVSQTSYSKIGRAVQQECRDRSRMPSSA